MLEVRNLISRWYPTSDNPQWLRVKRKTMVTEEKKFFGHGDLVNRDQAGNGYHGNCSNCGLPLVTDIGYNSWENTPCIVRANSVTQTHPAGWTTNIKRAPKLSPEECRDIFNDLISNHRDFNYNTTQLPEGPK